MLDAWTGGQLTQFYKWGYCELGMRNGFPVHRNSFHLTTPKNSHKIPRWAWEANSRPQLFLRNSLFGEVVAPVPQVWDENWCVFVEKSSWADKGNMVWNMTYSQRMKVCHVWQQRGHCVEPSKSDMERELLCEKMLIPWKSSRIVAVAVRAGEGKGAEEVGIWRVHAKRSQRDTSL